MSCEDVRAAIPIYLDEELSAPATLDVEAHLRACPECAAIVENERAFRAAFKTPEHRLAAPTGLEERVRDAVVARARAVRPRREAPWMWLGIAASFVLGVALATLVARMGLSRASDRALAEEILSSHLRSLQTGHLTDVLSSDRHAVKPWFNGKLDFSPPVPDLSADGFPLAGGRLDVLQGRPVAALVYMRRLHVINVFAWRAGPERVAAQWTRNGFHLLGWERGGFAFCAVSDVEPRELAALEGLFEAQER